MKTCKPLAFLIFTISILPVFSQNSAPVISNVTALADTIFHRLTVRFDLADAENDNMEIFLSVSSDSGISYPYNTSNATGYIGAPVTAGNGKYIEWYYPDSLSTMLSRISVKLAADDHNAFDIQQIVNQIDTNRLKQNLQFVEGIRHRTTDSIHLQEVRDSLFGLFQSHGLQTRVHNFPFGLNYTGKNIVGHKPGILSTRTFIVDGHYDTVSGSPGADDNGSSIAAIMEILRVIAPLDLDNAVEFIGFDLEEAGLSGSEAYVVSGIQADEHIAGVINMDMIGYYSDQPNSQTVPPLFDLVFPDLYARLVADSFRGNFIISTANAASPVLLALFDSMATQYVPSLLVGSIQVPGNGELIADSRRSDHAAFWDSGYVALHISDGAETRNPNYHGPNDISSTVNYAFMGDVTKAVTATLLNLAGPLHADIELVSVKADSASGTLGVWEIPEDGCRISFSPNPTDGHFKIIIENCGEESIKFRIFSMEGKLVWQSALQLGKEIDLGNSVEVGYYIIEMNNSENSWSKKILVR